MAVSFSADHLINTIKSLNTRATVVRFATIFDTAVITEDFKILQSKKIEVRKILPLQKDTQEIFW